MEVVLRTRTREGIEVVLAALVYAKILEEHAAVDPTSRSSTEQSASPTPPL